jgi:hypothetical protein
MAPSVMWLSAVLASNALMETRNGLAHRRAPTVQRSKGIRAHPNPPRHCH